MTSGGQQRIDDMLLARAVEGLDSQEQAELEALLNPDVDHEHYEEAAARFWLGAGDPPEALPADVVARLYRCLDIAARPAPGPDETPPPKPPPPDDPSLRPDGLGGAVPATMRSRPMPAGLAAGVALLVAVGGWWALGGGDAGPSPETLAEARAELMDAPDAVRVEWEHNTEHVDDVSGYVVWSDERQRGFMTFRDIPPNDPSEYRYHAWLFAGGESGASPVNVGVFNAPDGSDEVIVPIRNSLPITQAERFAVTREPADEVSFSDSDSLLLLAQPSAAGET